MDISLLLPFWLVSLGVIAVPGPNILVIVSTSIQHGKLRGLQTVAGTSLAMAIQLLAVGVGTTSFVLLLAQGLSILKWLGVVYLLYLALRHLGKVFNEDKEVPGISGAATFARGFYVSLMNPKTLMFFSAFLPQFVVSPENYGFEIFFLSTSFWIMAAVLDSCFAIFSVKLKSIMEQQLTNRIRHGICSTLYLGAGFWLAASRRVQ